MSAEQIVSIDISAETIRSAYMKDGRPWILAQRKLSDFLPDGASGMPPKPALLEPILCMIKSESERVLSGQIRTVAAAVPNGYTYVETEELKEIAGRLGLTLTRVITRGEALAMQFGREKVGYFIGIIASAGGTELYLAECDDNVVDSKMYMSVSGGTQPDISKLCEHYREKGTGQMCYLNIARAPEWKQIYFCDSAKDLGVLRAVREQCGRLYGDSFELVSCGEEQIVSGLCRYAEVLEGAAGSLLLLSALPFSVEIRLNGENILSFDMATSIPHKKTKKLAPGKSAVLSVICGENAYGYQDLFTDQFTLSKDIPEREIEFSLTLELDRTIMLNLIDPRDNRILFSKKIR